MQRCTQWTLSVSIPAWRFPAGRGKRSASTRVAWDRVVGGGAASRWCEIVGQVVGIASISVWLALTVYFMSRAATPNATDAGNFFLAFAGVTVIFILIMSYWRRLFGD